jgi:MoxR-like ATPase
VAIEVESPEEVAARLGRVGYIADEDVATAVFLAIRLGKPILAEGPAGTGKTELAKATAAAFSLDLVRLQCYEGLDESKVLYEWDYRKQLLRLQAQQFMDGEAARDWAELEESIFSERFLLERPVLKAIRSPGDVLLLVDEVDRIEAETEALLLEVLSDYQVSIPELGTVRAAAVPLVVLTSNATRDLSEALKRRCLYLYMDYPSLDRERQIVMERVPGIDEQLATQVCEFVKGLRQIDLRKKPSISETLDWARTLVELEIAALDEKVASATLWVLLKHRSDIERALKELDLL